MASTLARTAGRVVYARVTPKCTRHIHITTPASEAGWLRKIFRGRTESENGNDNTEAPKRPKTVEGVERAMAESAKTRASTVEENVTRNTIRSTPVGTEAAASASLNTKAAKTRFKPKRKPLTSEQKRERYEETIAFMTPRLGRRPELALPKIRKATWIRLLGVCQTEEDLRRVVEMSPAWRDMGNQFDETFSEALIRRCVYLKNPLIALDVFGNFAKHNIPLTLSGARELLNALYDKHPLSSVITLTSLFDVYKLTPVAMDLPCCAMVVSSCLKDGSPEAMAVGNALLPHLKKLLKETGSQPIPRGQEKGNAMPSVWTSWALKKVDELLLKVRGKPEGWLRDWRLKNGHIAEAQPI